MSEIWNNPLMWKNKETQSPQKSTADFNLDALDLLIQQAEENATDAPDSEFGMHIPDTTTTSFQNILIGKPKAQPDDSFHIKLNNALADIPTGHSAFTTGNFSAGTAGQFDFYNALGIVGESGGIADRLGVSDGNAIETGMKSGMDVRTAVNNRDALKSILSLFSLSQGKKIDPKNLDYMREYAVTHNLDGLRNSAESFGMVVPDNISTTDLYYLTLSTKANQKDFDIILNNMNKML
jgi:hypothetical protein